MLSGKYKGSTKSIDHFPVNSNRPKLTKSWSFKDSILALRFGRTSLSETQESQYVSPKLYQLEDQFYHPASKCDVWRALCPQELPDSAVYLTKPVCNLSNEVFASVTGPKKGLVAANKWRKSKINASEIHPGNWEVMENRKAHGLSVSLYEKNLVTGKTNGDPIADAFVVRARHDSAYLAVADGVNWGTESMKAARSAVSAIYAYLECHLFGSMKDKHEIRDTRDAAQLLFEAFSYAQEEIVSVTTGLTTLCVALILPVLPKQMVNNSNPVYDETASPVGRSQFAVIIASVGDCQAFLLSKFHGIREITGWTRAVLSSSDDLNTESNGLNKSNKISEPPPPPARDFRDTGGALGAVYKNGKPELNNLICAVTLCDPGDIVLLGSDGLVDNFDPVITRLAVPESPHLDFVDEEEEEAAVEDQGEEHQEHEDVSPTDDLGVIHISNSSSAKSTSSSDSSKSPTSPLWRPSKSWLNNSSITPPPQVSIWPQPPPPPTTDPIKLFYPNLTSVNHPTDNETNTICAQQINFTNQLELNWYERRRYAAKELERVWHELDISTEMHKTPQVSDGIFSSKDLCEALINYAYHITAKRREWLENPQYAHLRQSQTTSHSNSENHNKNISNSNNNNDDDDDVNNKSCNDNNGYSFDTQKKWFTDMLKRMPGKLDHATVVAYEVGVYRGNENEVYEETAHRYHTPMTLNSPVHNSAIPSEVK
ncbi:unnamed protein product [Trichobilharzia szidati]|nr:unnamed protein product [Trichobilharzia szidati]